MSPQYVVNDTIFLLKVKSLNEFYFAILYEPSRGHLISKRMAGVAEGMWKYPQNTDHHVLDMLEGKRFTIYFFPAYQKGKQKGKLKVEGCKWVDSFRTLPEAIATLKNIIAKDFCEIIESKPEIGVGGKS